MASLTCEREFPFFQVEFDTEADEIVDLFRRFADDHLDHSRVAQARTGNVRILDMILEAIFRRPNASEASLSVRAVALAESVLRDDMDTQIGRDF